MNALTQLWPTHYTNRDGGTWILWPKGSYVSEALLKKMQEEEDRQPIMIYGDHIYSLAFHDPMENPRGGFARWDCINGWTTTIEEAEEKDTGV